MVHKVFGKKSGSLVMALNALNQPDCSILWSSIFVEGMNLHHRFFEGRLPSMKGGIWD